MMQSEIYTATQGLIGRQLQLDAVANNIANVDTTGFRETSPFFRSFNEALVDGPVNVLNNAVNNQPVAAGVFFHSRQGAIKETGNPFDLAVEGEGFFKVDTPFGRRYTRNGNFTLRPINDENAQLVTKSGNLVLDADNNPIQVSLRAENTHVNRNGEVVQDGVVRGTVGLVTFADTNQLTPEEDTLLALQDPLAQEQQAQGLIQGGFLEGSNVNIAKQMIDMMSGQRAYDANIRAIRTIDTNMNQAVLQGFGAR